MPWNCFQAIKVEQYLTVWANAWRMMTRIEGTRVSENKHSAEAVTSNVPFEYWQGDVLVGTYNLNIQ
jgi:hypothetical protein